MRHEPSESRYSRRSLLGVAATIVAGTGAGCLGSASSADDDRQQIEPTEPSEPREGTPGEFYYFLEVNGIAVDSLHREDDDLVLVYDSSAESLEESEAEIGVIYQIYRQALIQRGSDVEQLIAEIDDPFDEQAEAWGLHTEWIEQLEAGELSEIGLWNMILETMVGTDRTLELEGDGDADGDGSGEDTDDDEAGDGSDGDDEDTDAESGESTEGDSGDDATSES